ncbi:hypothetical protein L3X39_03515 [Sabulilitoribacter multivorans]|uniref:Uncharacterized protein n=1 Tax=Flaviramulus multivorans TaxID=1304750 RepID=A0ABS9IG21_9FLAO|nr:hypothetical protein [Flaviramulus multivorans]MCF7559693.1 hypothetical protein [Flaviramulus multivorans]
MKKKIFYVALIVSSFCGIAQEEVLRIKNTLKTSDREIEKTFTIVDYYSDDLAVFLKDKDFIYAYLYNNKFELLNTVTSETLAKKYKEFLGTSISNGSYNLFICNDKYTAFGMISFSFDLQVTKLVEIDFEYKKESFLQSISHKNNFYILTAIENGFNLYTFDSDGKYEKTYFDLSKEKFLSKKNGVSSLNFALSDDRIIRKTIEVHKIQSSNPNAIELTSENIKMYVIEDDIIISVDNTTSYTQLIKINLKNHNATVENFEKPFIHAENEYFRSNSFLYDDKLFQLVSTRNELAFSIKDLQAKTTIKEYRVEKNDSITFKNSPIIQEKGSDKAEDVNSLSLTFGKYRELEKTKKFLRKITAQKIGISAYNINGIHQITLGGIRDALNISTLNRMGNNNMFNNGFNQYEFKITKGPSNSGFPSAPQVEFISVNPSFEPITFSYLTYNNTTCTFINCLFNENFEHIEGEIQENVFDKISDFKSDKEKFINAETIFKYNDSLFFGSCLGDCKEYTIMKFED